MDPRTGELYDSPAMAREFGVEDPVEIIGTREQAERISDAVKKVYSAEQRIARKKKKKAARKARRLTR